MPRIRGKALQTTVQKWFCGCCNYCGCHRGDEKGRDEIPPQVDRPLHQSWTEECGVDIWCHSLSCQALNEFREQKGKEKWKGKGRKRAAGVIVRLLSYFITFADRYKLTTSWINVVFFTPNPDSIVILTSKPGTKSEPTTRTFLNAELYTPTGTAPSSL